MRVGSRHCTGKATNGYYHKVGCKPFLSFIRNKFILLAPSYGHSDQLCCQFSVVNEALQLNDERADK